MRCDAYNYSSHSEKRSAVFLQYAAPIACTEFIISHRSEHLLEVPHDAYHHAGSVRARLRRISTRRALRPATAPLRLSISSDSRGASLPPARRAEQNRADGRIRARDDDVAIAHAEPLARVVVADNVRVLGDA